MQKLIATKYWLNLSKYKTDLNEARDQEECIAPISQIEIRGWSGPLKKLNQMYMCESVYCLLID